MIGQVDALLDKPCLSILSVLLHVRGPLLNLPQLHPLLRTGQGQLGAEGYIMGSQYMILGLIVAAGTHLLPRLRDEHKRRTWGYILLVAGFLTFRSIMGTFIWKTHMKTEWY